MHMNRRNFLGAALATTAVAVSTDAACLVVSAPFANQLPVLVKSEQDLWMNVNPDTNNPVYAYVGTVGAHTNVWDPETTTTPGSCNILATHWNNVGSVQFLPIPPSYMTAIDSGLPFFSPLGALRTFYDSAFAGSRPTQTNEMYFFDNYPGQITNWGWCAGVSKSGVPFLGAGLPGIINVDYATIANPTLPVDPPPSGPGGGGGGGKIVRPAVATAKSESSTGKQLVTTDALDGLTFEEAKLTVTLANEVMKKKQAAPGASTASISNIDVADALPAARATYAQQNLPRKETALNLSETRRVPVVSAPPELTDEIITAVQNTVAQFYDRQKAVQAQIAEMQAKAPPQNVNFTFDLNAKPGVATYEAPGAVFKETTSAGTPGKKIHEISGITATVTTDGTGNFKLEVGSTTMIRQAGDNTIYVFNADTKTYRSAPFEPAAPPRAEFANDSASLPKPSSKKTDVPVGAFDLPERDTPNGFQRETSEAKEIAISRRPGGASAKASVARLLGSEPAA